VALGIVQQLYWLYKDSIDTPSSKCGNIENSMGLGKVENSLGGIESFTTGGVKQISAQVDASHKKVPKDNETDIRKLYDELDLANRKPLDRLSKRFMSPSNFLITGDDIVKLLGFSALLIGIGWVHSEYKVRRLHLRD
jgi:hypothetical protein